MGTITLGGAEYTVAPPLFGALKKVLPPFVSTNILTEEGLDAAGALIAATIVRDDDSRMTPAEFDLVPTNWAEILKALSIVGPLVGLKWSAPGESASGEAKAAA